MQEATFLKEKFDAKPSLVHVPELIPMAYQSGNSLPYDDNEHRKPMKRATKQLYDLTKQLGIPESACYLAKGAAKLAITDLAKEIGADLMVIGKEVTMA